MYSYLKHSIDAWRHHEGSIHQDTPTSILSVDKGYASKDYDSCSFTQDLLEDYAIGDEEVFHLELEDEDATPEDGLYQRRDHASKTGFSVASGAFCHLTPGESPPSKKVVLHFQSPDKKIVDGGKKAQRKEALVDFKPEDVSVYALDMYMWKLGLEKRMRQAHIDNGSPGVLAVQSDVTIEMRRTLLQWLVAVNRQFEFTLDTFCLMVNIMDRFLSLQPINRDCLQLVGLTAFFIAAKHEEVEPPEISELVSLCAQSYEAKQFRWMEYIVLSRIKFELMVPTVSFFLEHLIEFGDQDRQKIWPRDITRKLVEKILCENRFAQCLPSKLAAKIHDFLLRNFVTTCMVANLNSYNPLSTVIKADTNPNVVNNFYQMMYHNLSQDDEL